MSNQKSHFLVLSAAVLVLFCDEALGSKPCIKKVNGTDQSHNSSEISPKRKVDRVRSVTVKNAEIFQEIAKAQDEKDYTKMQKLLDELRKRLGIKTKVSCGNASSGLPNDPVKARQRAEKLLSNPLLNYTQRAHIHHELGNIFFSRDMLDEALVEFLEILKMPIADPRIYHCIEGGDDFLNISMDY